MTKSKMKRVPTGIPGFDSLVEGGFPVNSSIVILGGPGTGKTIFATEFLIKGATDFKEKGLYITFEQRAEALREQASQFGWDLEALEKKGVVKIMPISMEKITRETIEEIKKIVRKEGVKRLVIDSLSTLLINAPIYTSPSELSVKDVIGSNVVFSPAIIGDYVVKRFVYKFVDELRNLDCTTLLIAEAGQVGEYLTKDGLSEYVCDGIVSITFESLGGEFPRSLLVRKMRETKNDEDIHPMEIGKSGIVVHGVVK